MIYSVTDIEKVKEQIKPELLSHPLFKQEWDRVYSYMSQLSGKSSFNLVISEDGKTLSVKEQYVSKDKNEKIKNNSELTQTKLILDDQGGLIVDRSVGTNMEVSGYIDCLCQKGDGSIDYDRRKKMTEDLSRFSSILSTYYSRRVFDKDGIEMHNDYFSDTYPLSGFRVGEPLDQQVLTELHKPQNWGHNVGPELPKFISNANYSYTYRFYDNLGLSTTVNAKGITSNLSIPNPSRETRTFQSEVNTEYPEILYTPIEGYAVAVLNPDQNSHEKMIGANTYEGVPLFEISKRVALQFEKGITSSKTREFTPSIYAALEEKVKTANARFKPSEEQTVTDTPDQQHVR